MSFKVAMNDLARNRQQSRLWCQSTSLKVLWGEFGCSGNIHSHVWVWTFLPQVYTIVHIGNKTRIRVTSLLQMSGGSVGQIKGGIGCDTKANRGWWLQVRWKQSSAEGNAFNPLRGFYYLWTQTLLPYAFNVQEPLLITVSLPRPNKALRHCGDISWCIPSEVWK